MVLDLHGLFDIEVSAPSTIRAGIRASFEDALDIPLSKAILAVRAPKGCRCQARCPR
jgi:hypothetical protein